MSIFLTLAICFLRLQAAIHTYEGNSLRTASSAHYEIYIFCSFFFTFLLSLKIKFFGLPALLNFEIVFEKATERVEGIDVQVILGDSFVNFLATGAKPDPNVNPEDLAANASDAPTTETTP